MPPRISVVLPVYDVAPYLETCLRSLAAQTVGDELEVIVVDDGSRDGSDEIAERFAATDARFRMVRQENAGLGAARNTGIGLARGEFLAFADSDDAVPPDAYETLVTALDESGSDFASGNVFRLTDRGVAAGGVPRVGVREEAAPHARHPFPGADHGPGAVEQALPALVLGPATDSVSRKACSTRTSR